MTGEIPRIIVFKVGSQFFNIFKSPKKFGDMVVNNLMHVPIDQSTSKTKIIGLPDLQFGELQVHN